MEWVDFLLGLYEGDYKKFLAISEAENINTAIEQFDDYILYEDVSNHEELGEYFFEQGLIGFEIPNDLARYFDFEAYGRNVDLGGQGMFTDYGYLDYIR